MANAVTTQETAIDATLAAYDHVTDTATAFTSLHENTFPANNEQIELFTQLRAAVRALCEAVRDFVTICGPDGPAAGVWAGATPPHELFSAAQITLEPGFFDRLDTWSADSAAVLTGLHEGKVGHDPAGPVTAACSRARGFLADKQHDAMLAAAEQFANGPHSVSVESGITPGGGRVTNITFGPLDSDRDLRPAPTSRLSRWRADRRRRRDRERRDRTVYHWARRNLLHHNPQDSALALALRAWLQIADPETIAMQSWYACYFVSTVVRELGYPATMSTVDIQFRYTAPAPDSPTTWGHTREDPFNPPNAVVILPATGQILDPLGGNSYFEPDTEPVLLTTDQALTPGATFTTPVGHHTELTYTLNDEAPTPNPHHAQACRAIDNLIAASMSSPQWDHFRAAP
ncbi:hypothetical protein [Nocardia brasiliensis]|uniref:hypothetical protein n=1 Tax=Nocardia brasiliensis TaxID=37326 RepID=UPI002458ECCA|nr:hypothetical protein [Nocardia brasiliensis]